MSKKNISVLFLLFFINNFFAQNLKMYFPAFQGKTYDFIIFQGSNAIKAQTGTIASNGNFVLSIPEKYRPYTGMCRWLITNSKEGGGLDMAIQGNDFSISCTEATPTEKNIVFKEYNPLQGLNSLYTEQQKIVDKYRLINQTLSLYDESSPLYTSLRAEKSHLKKDFEDFRNRVDKNDDYNAKFLVIVSLTLGIADKLAEDGKQNAEFMTSYIGNKLNLNGLYTSGHWGNVLEMWVKIHLDNVKNDKRFVEDFQKMSSQLAKPEIYADYVEQITKNLTKYGGDHLIEAIAPAVRASGKITNYSNSLSIYKNGAVGDNAPNVSLSLPMMKKEYVSSEKMTSVKISDLLGKNDEKLMLVFYSSECGYCDDLLTKLIQNYKKIASKKVKIYSFSSDQEEDMFLGKAQKLPWMEKYCDYEGTKGVNYKNYGVLGTPTVFVINKSGVIEKRTASFEEIMKELQ